MSLAPIIKCQGFPSSLMVKEFAYNAGDMGSIPGLWSSPREENGNPHQYSCLGNPMDRGVWWATVQGVTKSQTRLSDWVHTHISLSETAMRLNTHPCITLSKTKQKKILWLSRSVSDGSDRLYFFLDELPSSPKYHKLSDLCKRADGHLKESRGDIHGARGWHERGRLQNVSAVIQLNSRWRRTKENLTQGVFSCYV